MPIKITKTPDTQSYKKMSIFNFYPKIDYAISDYSTIRSIDISTSVRIKSAIKSYTSIAFVPYVVSDGERPDQVSTVFYGNPYYDWIILMTNDMYSIYDDWPKSSKSLEQYIIRKYGSIAKAESIVNYYNKYGDSIAFYEYNLLSQHEKNLSKIENAYEFELRMNINKSKIKLIRSDAVKRIESDLSSTIQLAIE